MTLTLTITGTETLTLKFFQSETSFPFLAVAERKTCNFQSRVG